MGGRGEVSKRSGCAATLILSSGASCALVHPPTTALSPRNSALSQANRMLVTQTYRTTTLNLVCRRKLLSPPPPLSACLPSRFVSSLANVSMPTRLLCFFSALSDRLGGRAGLDMERDGASTGRHLYLRLLQPGGAQAAYHRRALEPFGNTPRYRRQSEQRRPHRWNMFSSMITLTCSSAPTDAIGVVRTGME